MTDIVKRLRDQSDWHNAASGICVMLDAADEIARLRAAVREFLDAETAVQKEAARALANGDKGWSSEPTVRRIHAVGALRKAMAPSPDLKVQQQPTVSSEP